jgi:outer membrane cobalamin receptor
MHLDARYRFVRNWELFGRVNNLFDEAFGVLSGFNREAPTTR